MADEIVSVWDNVNDMVAELVSDEMDSRKTKRLSEEITSELTMQFRLEDGAGNPVVWPLKLISDTTPSVLTAP